MVTLEEARKVIAAAEKKAREISVPMDIAVVDDGGHLLTFARMDGANPRILRHAIRKAYTAALMCRHTLSFKRDLEEREGGLDQWGDPNLTTLPGGLAVQSGDQFVGGVGTGGGGADDEAVARAMVKAMGFTVMEDRRSL